MNLLAQGVTVAAIFERFFENVGIWHILGMVVGLIFSGYVVIRQRPDLPLILMFACSLMTNATSDAINTTAFLGRWYFLALAGLTVPFRLGRTNPPILWLTAAWAALNCVGAAYTPDIEKGLVRGLYFGLVVPGLILSMVPPFETPDSIVRFLRRIGLVGVALAAIHLVFLVIAGPGGGTARFKSCYQSPQTMSLATCVATLPMIWALLSKSAGRLSPVFLGATFINLIVMIASTQRTAIFSMAGAVGIILYFYRSRGVIIAIVTGGAIALIAWPLITFLISEDFLIQRLSNLESAGRSIYWAYGIEEGMKSPLIGHGSGAGTYVMTMTFRHKFHQAYIAVFYDFGFPGLFIFLAMIFTGSWVALRLAYRRHEPRLRALGVFLLASIAMVAVHGLVETGLADTANQTAVMLYMSLGLAGAVSRMREATDGEELSLSEYLGYNLPPGYGPLPAGFQPPPRRLGYR